MLLAEIHGKRNASVHSDEDYLTSAVFGHLRHIRDGVFWTSLFRKAHSNVATSTNLASELECLDLELASICTCRVNFWPNFPDYSEPDLLLRFESKSGKPVLILVEVKLYSGKSGVGENDQLARYYRLCQKETQLAGHRLEKPLDAIVYLTERYAMRELQESIAQTGDPAASRKMFAMQWQDVLRTALERELHDPLLCEVAEFLRRRDMEAFQGMRNVEFHLDETAGFYATVYFNNMPELTDF